MTISKILQKIHRKFSKDSDYPESGSEDLLVYLDHVDDAISEWEDCVLEGYSWKELKTSATLVLGGSGTDSLPDDFLSFVRRFNVEAGGFSKAKLQIGSTVFSEVTAGEGSEMAQAGLSPNVFWSETGNIRTLPAASGSITFPYLKKATRFQTGTEVAEPEMENHKFIEDYAVAKVFLDNADDVLYQSFMLSAEEKLKKMKYNALI